MSDQILIDDKSDADLTLKSQSKNALKEYQEGEILLNDTKKTSVASEVTKDV